MTHWEIKTFLEIVKYSSISKAAEKLFLTQSTVSHRLSVLEEELGVRLIIRRQGHRSIELTNDGEAFLPLAYEYEALWERIEIFCRSGSKAIFSIGCHASMNDSIFYKLLNKLLESNTSITKRKMTFRLESHTTEELYQLLESGHINIAFLRNPQENRNFVIEPFFAEKRKMTFRLESHTTEELYQLLESGHINIAFLRNPQENRNFVIEPFFAEEYRLIVSDMCVYTDRKIDLGRLDRKREIDLAGLWGSDFMRWHDETFGSESMADISINSVFTIPKYLTRTDQWAIVPVSVAEELTRTGQLQALEIKNPPPVLYCYKVYLKSQNRLKSETFELFEQVLDDFMDTMPKLKRIRTIYEEKNLPDTRPY